MPTYTVRLNRDDSREIEVRSTFRSAVPRGRDRYGWTEPSCQEHEDSISIESAEFTDTGETAYLTDDEQEQVLRAVEAQRHEDEEARSGSCEDRNEFRDHDIERAEHHYERGLFREPF